MEIIQTINLAGLIVDVYTDDSFEKIRGFIDKFRENDHRNRNTKVKVFFLKNPERKLELSEDWKSLSIVGNNIDDLFDPFNLMGITQALFRFAAIHLAQRGVFLLHGSTAVLDDRVICFGDDGSSTAKTLGSLEIALKSKRYVADEFCFFDINNRRVFGYSFIPIHIRPIVREHLKSFHNLVIPKEYYKQTEAGEFISQEKLFETTPGKLAALVYIHFLEGSTQIKKLSQREAYRSFKFCMVSHIAKLLHPNLDRMQFSSMTDANEVKVIDEKIIDKILSQITNNKLNQQILELFPSYKLIISQPCQVVSLLKEEISQAFV